MRRLAKFTLSLVCAGYAALAHADFPEELVKRFPAAQGAKVERAFPGFWSVAKGGDVFFVRDDLSILISGEVVDLNGHRSLTQSIRDANPPRIDVAQLNLHDAIKFGSGSRRLYIFSDPDCPYCRKLEGTLTKLTDVTIYIFPFPLAGHPNAAEVSEGIWCQKDRAAAWKAYQDLTLVTREPQLLTAWQDYLAKHKQPAQPACDNPIARNLEFGRQWNIAGTPALVFEDGTLIPGLVPAPRLEAQLAKSHANLTASK
ncbi:thioredoxin-like domain protein [Burkholderia pseudomallei]|uniref:DsbC family protein n=1 Tax=Burkholderia pseudomallei TaxID=28450 RepID=UPI0005102E1D|nr:DsbC family protein [Burkholderia pseudomallei]KGC70244.1 thioredoxin-like domain protein [Burkholderia pseudomallei]